MTNLPPAVRNEIAKMDFIRQASGPYLSEYLPENHTHLTEEELYEHISNSTWEPLEQLPPEEVYQVILDQAMNDTEVFVQRLAHLNNKGVITL